MKSLILRVAFWLLISMVSNVALADGPSVPVNQLTELIDSIQKDMDESDKWVDWNQKLDITAKIVVFLLAVASAIGAARAGSLGDKDVPSWLKMTNTALTSVTALVTAVAFTQFDFAKRQAIWERKYHALEACSVTLKFRNPNIDALLEQLEIIRMWGDRSSLSELNASCNAGTAKSKNAPAAEAARSQPEGGASTPAGSSSKPASK